MDNNLIHLPALIHQLIECRASQYPEAIAVSYDRKVLTYKELNEKSNQLSNLLKTMNITAETIIGISVDRSLEMIIGILGILKAGCAYVPIDPNYPKSRILHILKNSKISLLVTQPSLQEKLLYSNVNLIYLDSNIQSSNFLSEENSATFNNADRLAYVLYTSGSTGIPKGVIVTHSNLVHTYAAWEKVYELTHQDCHLQMANFAFDVFTGDFIRALCSGAKLVICPSDYLLNPEKLYDLMIKEKINCAEFVPTVLRHLFEYIEEKNLSLKFMRLLVCGSDSWSIHEYKQLQISCGKNTRVINSYGLTETTIDCAYFEENISNKKYLSLTDAVPIGKPFPHAEIFLLDKDLNEVPHGEMGEIYIGGAGVARGYLNEPQLTNEKFITHPDNQFPKRILCKTGDFGRVLPDGNIEFLGRIDNQVKLRGIRVELSHIQSVLNTHPSIRESLVILSENERKHKQLIAYIVFKQGQFINIFELRTFLKIHLPYQIIPAHFYRVDFLPLTPNGKLDHQALKNRETIKSDKNYVASQNSLEAQLIETWKRLLNREQIGITDDFFYLGGDSLLLATLMRELENKFFVKIQFPEIPQTLTITELEQKITELNII